MKKEEKEITIEKALRLLNEAIKKGISNYKIAQDTKITDRSIGNYVNGNTKPTLANAHILIDYFDKINNIHVVGDGNLSNTGITGGDVIMGSDQEVKALKKRIKELEAEVKELKTDKAILHEFVIFLQKDKK